MNRKSNLKFVWIIFDKYEILQGILEELAPLYTSQVRSKSTVNCDYPCIVSQSDGDLFGFSISIPSWFTKKKSSLHIMQRGQSLMMIPIIHVLLISVGGIQMEIPIISPYVTKKKILSALCAERTSSYQKLEFSLKISIYARRVSKFPQFTAGSWFQWSFKIRVS